VISHRPATILWADRILVFDQGVIVEDGSHTELLARQGAYQRLWSRQAGGFVLDDGAAEGSGVTAKFARVNAEEEEEAVAAEETPEEVIGHDRNPKRRPARER